MKNTKAEILGAIGGIGAMVFFLLLSPVAAVDLDYSIAVTASDVSFVKVNTDYVGVTNETVTQYGQYVYSVGQKEIIYESDGYIGDNHDVSINTSLIAVGSSRSGIAGSDFVQNAFIGERNLTRSQNSFGIRGSGRNLTTVSYVTTTPTTLDQSFAIEADMGEVGTGLVKRTDNVSVRGDSEFRGRRVVVAGYHGVTIYPAGPAEEDSLKKRICPWSGDGEGFPVFTSRGPTYENETIGSTGYIIRRK